MDPWRLILLIAAAFMGAGMLWVAWRLRGNDCPERVDGCLATVFLAAGVLVGNYSRLYEAATPAVFISGIGVLLGLRYVVKYRATNPGKRPPP